VRSHCLRFHARVNNLEMGAVLMDFYDIVCGSSCLLFFDRIKEAREVAC